MPCFEATGATGASRSRGASRDPRGAGGAASGDGEPLGDQLGELDGVQRGTLAEVVVADEQREAAALGRSLVLTDATHEARVASRGLERRRDVGQGHAGGAVEQLTCALRGDGTRELGVD